MSDQKGRTIHPPADMVEVAAAIEASKTLAFYSLTFVLTGQGSVDHPIVRAIRDNVVRQIKNADVKLPAEDAARFKAYAEATIEELFGRMKIDGNDVNPKS